MRESNESNESNGSNPAPTSRLIDEIRAINPSAEIGFLASFSATELEDYRRRLQLACEAPKSLPWIRRNDVWPVAMRECA